MRQQERSVGEGVCGGGGGGEGGRYKVLTLISNFCTIGSFQATVVKLRDIS